VVRRDCHRDHDADYYATPFLRAAENPLAVGLGPGGHPAGTRRDDDLRYG